MKVVIFSSNMYYACAVSDNGDEHELTRAKSLHDLLSDVRNMAPTLSVEYHDDVIPPLVGQKEACEILGWDYPKNRSMINTYLHRGKFPRPIQTLASGPVWLRKQIEDYRDSRS